MKIFLLVLKSDDKPVYLGQEFQGTEAAGLIGGPYQSLCYWVDVTGLSQAAIDTRKSQIFTPDTPPGAIDENAVILDADGSWA